MKISSNDCIACIIFCTTGTTIDATTTDTATVTTTTDTTTTATTADITTTHTTTANTGTTDTTTTDENSKFSSKACVCSYTTVPLVLNFTYARVLKATTRNIHGNAPE